MPRNSVRSRPWGRALEIVLLLGAAAIVLGNLLGSAKRTRRDRRQQVEALHTWEGEGGAVTAVSPTARTVDRHAQTMHPAEAPLHGRD